MPAANSSAVATRLTNMKASIIPGHVNRFTSAHRREGKCFFSSLQVISLAAKPWNDGRLDPVISLRLYGTGSRNYACLWVGTHDFHTSGSGYAGGYGYHRPSSATEAAIRAAGFKLDTAIGGVGEEAMRSALLAIAKALKVKRPVIVESFQ